MAQPRLAMILAGLALCIIALPVAGGVIAADALPLPNRVARADVIVVGKVASIEDKTVMIAPSPGANKTEYKVAVVTVSDAILAPKATKTLRLGFQVIPPMVMINPRPYQASVGQEGCYFLRKVGDVYLLSEQLGFVAKAGPQFDKDLAVIKHCVKIRQEPDAALKGKNAEDRFLAAAMLITRYRTRHTNKDREEPIDAEQSKLILQALAAADWAPNNDFSKLSPLMVLHKLNLTLKDGFMPTMSAPAPYAKYAQKWIMDHAATYRIKKFVADSGK